MKLAIIAENDFYQASLSKALSVLGRDVRTYNYKNVSEDFIGDIIVCVVSEKTNAKALMLAEKCEAFAILMKDVSPKIEFLNEFRAVFPSPLRLGVLVDVLSAALKHHAQKELLKPLSLGKATLNPRTNEFSKNEISPPLKLTEKEQDILLYLQSNKGRSVRRQDLLDHVWGYAKGVETHTLETHIYRLRQKIEEDPANPNFLMTNDEGYYLNF